MTDRIAARVWLSALGMLAAVFVLLAERDPAPAKPVAVAQVRPVVVHRRIVRRTVVTRIVPAARTVSSTPAVTTGAPVVTTSAPAPAAVAAAPAAPVTTRTS